MSYIHIFKMVRVVALNTLFLNAADWRKYILLQWEPTFKYNMALVKCLLSAGGRVAVFYRQIH